MISLTEIGALIRRAGRLSNLISAEETRNDPDIIELCGSSLDELTRMQRELSPLIETLDSYEERLVMTLRFLKCFQYPMIADVMGVCQRSMYFYLKKAKAKLITRYPDKIEP